MLLSRPKYLGSAGLAEAFLEYVEHRAGLLSGRGGALGQPETYSFPHRVFQEYLTACHLLRQRDMVRTLFQHAREGEFWGLVVQLVAEELLYNLQRDNELLDLMYALCPASEHRSLADQRAVLWSGQMAALLGSERIARDTEQLRQWPGTPEPLATLLCQQDWRVLPPSEAEWEKAARGTDGRRYPWGPDADPDRANYNDTNIDVTNAVGCFPGGTSPYGVEEMSGNAWEWTRSDPEDYPYPADDTMRAQCETLHVGKDDVRVLRGGAFWRDLRNVRCASRSGHYARFFNDDMGVHVVLAVCTYFGTRTARRGAVWLFRAEVKYGGVCSWPRLDESRPGI